MQSNYLPPLEPIGDFRSYVCGDVVIDQTAAIASGVLIQADQGSKITIAAGVCIGMGTVIHAQDGLLEIGTGANLGAGVLVYGNSKIGEGCCIGASSSIVRAVIAKGAIVPPCSLISGLAHMAIEKEAIEKEAIEKEASNITETQVEIPIVSIPERSLESLELQSGELENGQNPQIDIEPNQQQITTDVSTLVNADLNTSVDANSAQAKAYAQAQINRYIKRLFPQN